MDLYRWAERKSRDGARIPDILRSDKRGGSPMIVRGAKALGVKREREIEKRERLRASERRNKKKGEAGGGRTLPNNLPISMQLEKQKKLKI
jgi:hypothetical protein